MDFFLAQRKFKIILIVRFEVSHIILSLLKKSVERMKEKKRIKNEV